MMSAHNYTYYIIQETERFVKHHLPSKAFLDGVSVLPSVYAVIKADIFAAGNMMKIFPILDNHLYIW